ncbi:AtpZ/AtpI family protein [Roseomonas sp. KE0001]|uniref:AtpZ/AtpI family protein n=1 Tax=unclassified Roseomonas TaxID=2617492 RepID=UPI0018DF0686|nr:AtpZ/AtpI family protein [Roseomonas sp. KE0001]MBI0434362.1 AtpZ/AtpI family protein [Roseomonas sp. KE0001]
MNEQNDFEARLRQARRKQGLEKDAGQGGNDHPDGLPPNAFQIGMRAGVEVVSALIAGAGLGWLLDHWLGSWPWLFMVFFVVGGVAGVMNVYRLFNPRTGARK